MAKPKRPKISRTKRKPYSSKQKTIPRPRRIQRGY